MRKADAAPAPGRRPLTPQAERSARRKEEEEEAARIRGSAVVFVGHIPAGFYEEAQFQFFSQYGKVSRLRLSRDKTSNRYRGYGFVEFVDAAVAHQVEGLGSRS